MGGLWEAGVKSLKTLFYKYTATRKYTFEELSTLLAKIEACLNSRALSQQLSTRWKDDYLKELHKRNKWQVPTENMRVGDMVE